MELIAALLAVIATLLAVQMSKTHERRVALFTVEVDELKQLFELAKRANQALQAMFEDYAAAEESGGDFMAVDSVRTKAQAEALINELQAPFLTPTDAFSSQWRNFGFCYVAAFNQMNVDAPPNGVITAMRDFESKFNEMVGTIRAGLKRFRAGKEVYLSTGD